MHSAHSAFEPSGHRLLRPRSSERQMSWWYGRSVAAGLSLPEGFPLALIAAVEGVEMADGVRPVLPPTHPGQLQPLSHHRLARALHRPVADAPALGQVLRVLHPMRVPLQIT